MEKTLKQKAQIAASKAVTVGMQDTSVVTMRVQDFRDIEAYVNENPNPFNKTLQDYKNEYMDKLKGYLLTPTTFRYIDHVMWRWEFQLGLLRHIANDLNGSDWIPNVKVTSFIVYNVTNRTFTTSTFHMDIAELYTMISFKSENIARHVIKLVGEDFLKSVFQIKQRYERITNINE